MTILLELLRCLAYNFFLLPCTDGNLYWHEFIIKILNSCMEKVFFSENYFQSPIVLNGKPKYEHESTYYKFIHGF